MATRGCVNSPDSFCYICGEVNVKKRQRDITDFVKKVYYAYFGIKLGDQDKSWAPHKVCSICVEELRQWSQGKKSSFRFGIPMVWREPRDHSSDCYFCSCNIKGFNLKHKKDIIYPNLPSAIRPVPHGSGIPVPTAPKELVDISEDSETELQDPDEEYYDASTSSEPQLFSQFELNDLVRDLVLSKDSAELLGSRLKEKNVLATGTSFSWFRYREKDFIPFFSQENDLVYCNDITGLVNMFNIQHNKNEWRLFIDSSKRSLKAVLLHNGNKYASIPVGHSVYMKECYENLSLVLNKLNYQEHGWTICGDLKVLSILLGQQGGYTKYPCFLCEWDSRDKGQHWIKKEWPLRTTLETGTKNILRESLVDPKNILLPPLHIKLGLMKQFVKALSKEGECFQYLKIKFPGISEAKLKEGIFVGPDIRRLMKDKVFVEKMTEVEKQAWTSLQEVIQKFLGNYKDPNFKHIVEDMLTKFKVLGCSMSLKVHFLNSHLDYRGCITDEKLEKKNFKLLIIKKNDVEKTPAAATVVDNSSGEEEGEESPPLTQVTPANGMKRLALLSKLQLKRRKIHF